MRYERRSVAWWEVPVALTVFPAGMALGILLMPILIPGAYVWGAVQWWRGRL